MATAPKYNTIAGFVQFDPNERDANGQTVRDIVVQAIGSGGRNVRITVWPEHSEVELRKGSFVVAQGKFTQSNVNGKEYLNLSANDLLVLESAAKTDREIENPVPEEDETDDSPF